MRGRKCCDHRHGGHQAAERQHGLDAFAGRHHIACRTEPDRVPEKVTHSPAWGIDRRLVAPGRIEPCAVCASDASLEVGNSRDHCWPDFGRSVCFGSIIAARMESQAVDAMQVGDAASPQIGFHDCSGNRL